jgi:hypothetical protein
LDVVAGMTGSHTEIVNGDVDVVLAEVLVVFGLEWVRVD